jgi:hypothetical protein
MPPPSRTPVAGSGTKSIVSVATIGTTAMSETIRTGTTSWTRPPGENVVDVPDAGPCAVPMYVKNVASMTVPVVHGAPCTVYWPPSGRFVVATLTGDPSGESGTAKLAIAAEHGSKRQTL